MRICPQCKNTYDDSWKVCLKCGIQLVESGDSGISGAKFVEFAKGVSDEFKKIDSRLKKIEKSLNIEMPATEKSESIIIPEIRAIPERKIQAKETVEKPAGSDIESTIGLVWLNRIGLVALFLGVAFFLKYAFDNRWIGELGRVMLGLVAGFGMIAGSEFTRRKNYAVMAQGLHGGGVGILYLSIFAAFGFYHLIGLLPAFVFMGIVTLYCGFWSTHTDWISSAVIGLVGGFLTPFLMGTGNLPPSLLFSYIILLDAGVLFISIHKKWKILNLGSFFLTHTVYCNWYSINYKQDLWIPTALFVTAFFAMFCIISILRNLIRKEKSDQVDIVLVLFNGIAYFAELYYILKPFAGALPGLLPLTLGCVYIGYSYSALSRCREDRSLILSYVGLAVIFVTIAIPIQLKHSWVTISWAIESLVLIWLGFRLAYPDIRGGGLIIGVLSILKLLFVDYSYNPFDYGKNAFIFNERMAVYAIVIAMIFLASWLYKKNKENVSPDEKAVSTFLVLLANFVILVQLSVESKTYFAHMAHLRVSFEPGSSVQFYETYRGLFSARELTLSLLWVMYAFLLVAIGMIKKFRALRLMALVLFGFAIAKIFLCDLSQLDRAYRIISFISLGIVLMIASFFYQRYRSEIRSFL